MKNTTLTKTKQQTKSRENTNAGLDAISKNSIVIMGGISALIGVWAVVSLISAMVGNGGPFELAQSWFRAITGM